MMCSWVCKVSPHSVDALFGEGLFAELPCVCMTSATLYEAAVKCWVGLSIRADFESVSGSSLHNKPQIESRLTVSGLVSI